MKVLKNYLSVKTLKLITVTLALAISAVFFVPQAAQASAYGCAAGNPQYGPTNYCVYLSGSGTYVNYVHGSWSGSAFVCNAYITAEFFDYGWNWYQTLRSGTQYGCGTGGGATIGVYSNKWQGYMCSTLHYANINVPPNRTMSVCHQIHV